jgi:hypothetical protein
VLLAQPWQTYHVKDSDKGPMVWEAKRVTIVLKDANDLPGLVLELVAARDVRDREKVKYFVSDAPAETATDPMLLVGLTRWHVERCFEDGKSELGFDHWEGRSYLGLKRHQTVSALSVLLLAETRHALGGENREWTVCQVRTAAAALVEGLGLGSRGAKRLAQRAARSIDRAQGENAKARESHWRSALAELGTMGIRLSRIIRCRWTER